MVIVPAGRAGPGEARSGLGSVRVYGRRKRGIGAELSAPAPAGAPVIRLEATVGIGEVRVDHG